MTRGRFITFEGGEGSGKTTQIQLLAEALKIRGIEHRVTREPGGTVLAEKIRPLLVERQEEEEWQPLAETLLFLAARIQHWQMKIAPALAAGHWVICDRFIDSTLVYQGIGKDLGVSYLADLHRLTGGRQWIPDVTFLLDIDPEQGLKRAKSRAGKEMRYEELDISFHRRLREGFLEMAGVSSGRYQILAADQPPENLHRQILERLV